MLQMIHGRHICQKRNALTRLPIVYKQMHQFLNKPLFYDRRACQSLNSVQGHFRDK